MRKLKRKTVTLSHRPGAGESKWESRPVEVATYLAGDRNEKIERTNRLRGLMTRHVVASISIVGSGDGSVRIPTRIRHSRHVPFVIVSPGSLQIALCGASDGAVPRVRFGQSVDSRIGQRTSHDGRRNLRRSEGDAALPYAGDSREENKGAYAHAPDQERRPSQKINFRANWICRDVFVVEASAATAGFGACEYAPARLAEFPPANIDAAAGVAKFGWFRILKNSARN